MKPGLNRALRFVLTTLIALYGCEKVFPDTTNTVILTNTFTVATYSTNLTITIECPSPTPTNTPLPILALSEAFYGSFPSWGDAKIRYGAKGDGVADDTAALQAGLNAVAAHIIPVLYLPGGTYRITKTLTISATEAPNVIGEHPLTTSLVWDGPAGGFMFTIDGVNHARFDRITYDGRGKVDTCINQSWNGTTGFFDTGNSYSDLILKGANLGMSLARNKQGGAEVTIERCRFIGLPFAALWPSFGAQNSIDIFFLYNRVENCGYGITVSGSACGGNWHDYGNLYLSNGTNVYYTGGGIFTHWGGYSSNSVADYVSTSGSAYSCVQSNTIVDSRGTAISVTGGNAALLALDNNVVNGPTISIYADADRLLAGNRTRGGISGSGRTVVFDNAGFSGSVIQPVLPQTPVRSTKLVVELTPALLSVPLTNTNVIYHLSMGIYPVTNDIIIGTNVTFVGDGFYSRIVKGGVGGQAKLIAAPGSVLSDFSIVGSIVASGSVYLKGFGVTQCTNNVVVNGGTVEAMVYYVSESKGVETTVNGGKANIFFGAGCCSPTNWLVNSGTLLVRGHWSEAGMALVAKTLPGTQVTLDGLRMAHGGNGNNSNTRLADLGGDTLILRSLCDGTLTSSGSPVVGYSLAQYINGKFLSGMGSFLSNRSGLNANALSDSGATDWPTKLSQLRNSHPSGIGITRIKRVRVSNAATGLTVNQ